MKQNEINQVSYLEWKIVKTTRSTQLWGLSWTFVHGRFLRECNQSVDNDPDQVLAQTDEHNRLMDDIKYVYFYCVNVFP